MSSTNRGADRHKFDYYVTPIRPILDFLEVVEEFEPTIFKGFILDPCAGGDTDHEMSYPTALKEYGV